MILLGRILSYIIHSSTLCKSIPPDIILGYILTDIYLPPLLPSVILNFIFLDILRTDIELDHKTCQSSSSIGAQARFAGFLIKETPLSTDGWFDAMLKMKISEKLPKVNFDCRKDEFYSVADLETFHLSHEKCIHDKFIENWDQANQTCYPHFLMNSNVNKR